MDAHLIGNSMGDETMNFDKELDVRNLSCSLPVGGVVTLRKKLAWLKPESSSA